jgi:hypothetical protein
MLTVDRGPQDRIAPPRGRRRVADEAAADVEKRMPLETWVARILPLTSKNAEEAAAAE